MKEAYWKGRRQEIIGLFGYNMAQRKYSFTTYTPGTSRSNARIIPGEKQTVANNSVQVDAGESIQVQNHQRVITFAIKPLSKRPV